MNLQKYFDAIELLSNKIKEPSRSIELISTKEQLEHTKSIIEQANLEIKKHNEIVKNYPVEKKNLIASIWKYVTESYKSEIEAYRTQSNGLAKGIKKLKEEYLAKESESKTLDDEIKNLTKNVTSVQPTVDEINRLLKSYGFLNFEITSSEKEPNHYQIKREDGTLAEETLSEGEITFLTFLYFLQLTKGATDENKITDKKILVIDDPISSLDSNILFVVSTLIKNITRDIKNNIGNIQQLILLTHNVYFHKEVSFIDGRNNGDKDTFYWIVRKKNKISTFNAYEMNNPIQTSYQLLWQELNDKEKNSSVTIQNTMRRIIENYFKILGDYKDNSLISKFEILEEQIICKSLMSWINDGSHVIQDDLYIELQDDVIDKYLEVFKKIFVFTNHEGHYNMMMKIENLGSNNVQ
jgi:wobble nucleotide-excising tRNase